ncbi:hypothetical protein [Thiorhodovibrio litoralis]|uniref:hypothetical protein n=1 Tax=Thiorhodovibrio litoralis TaxID=2952932 RepID=UPI002B2593C3|nr:hypothetical protein [Thiorhodovibrio litoralis]
MQEFKVSLLKKASLILLTFSIFSGATHAACQEEQKHCYYFEGNKLISDSACEVVQCANISGGSEVWTWSNGNKVDV